MKDKSGKCNSYKKFCQNPKYKAKLASQCPATCGVCIKSKPEAKTPTATGTGAVCKDNVPAQCGKMKRFCGQPKYEKVLKQKCSKTCGFCTSESDGSDPTSSPAASSGGKKWFLQSQIQIKFVFSIKLITWTLFRKIRQLVH